MKNGPITGSCWLTSNASDDWDSIQLKINYHLINGWERSGMVSIYSKTDPRPAVEETVYGKEYYEVADYFFIGDPELIDHIKEIVQ